MSPRPKTLSAPGKTFLVGEYLALDGGPSILLSTQPRFELRIRVRDGASDENQVGESPFAVGSPAAHLFAKHKTHLANLILEFVDPHQGLGGLGASSAQFALLWAHLYGVGGSLRGPSPKVDRGEGRSSVLTLKDLNDENLLSRLLTEYRECAWSGEGTPPSGHDVIAQLTGGVCQVLGARSTVTKPVAESVAESVSDSDTDTRLFSLPSGVQSLRWNFSQLSFTLVRTGHKLATHEHLKNKTERPYARLRELVLEAEGAFLSGASDREARLCAAVNSYALALVESSLMAPSTAELLTLAYKEKFVRAAKGCGALGADVILILHDRSSANEVKGWAERLGLRICGTEQDLAPGLEVMENV